MANTISPEDHVFIFVRDNYKCRYCGFDGTLSYEHYQRLQNEHLLPEGNPQRFNRDFIVVACDICNLADNRFFNKLEKYGLKLDGKTPEDLVTQKKPYIEKWRKEIEDIWRKEMEEYRRRIGKIAPAP